jgi:tripartite-type tricarboxylate transporter receptor subunit TctC
MKLRCLYCLGSIFGVALILSQAPFAVHAQDKYPERPIRLLVPFSAGASTDLMARKLSAKLTPLLGQPVVVENRTGAAGTIAATEVARAKPDGYTLIFGTVSTHVLNQLTMSNVPYDALKDFSHVFLLGTSTTSVSVHPTIAASLPELIKRVRAMPGKYSYGSSGQGSILHLAGELFKNRAGGLDMLHVPYRGSGASVTDLIGGQIPVAMMALGTALPYHRAGKLRALAAMSEKRSQVAPDVPTVLEYGIRGVVSYSCVMVSGPAGMPKPVIDQLHQAIARMMPDEAFQKDMLSVGFDPVTDSSPQKTTQFIRDEIARWEPVIKEIGLKPN